MDFVLLRDISDDVILPKVSSVGTAKRRVSLGNDVVFLEPSDELDLGALERELDLV